MFGTQSPVRQCRSQGQDAPEVTDGPFAESKEFLVGYWIVDVDSAERAYAIAGKASTAPGPGERDRIFSADQSQSLVAARHRGMTSLERTG